MITYETTEEKENEARIHAQQERYRTLVESTSAILWEGDPETFAFTFVNQEAEKVLGYPAEEWIGDPEFWPRHIHPADREWAVNFCQSAIWGTSTPLSIAWWPPTGGWSGFATL